MVTKITNSANFFFFVIHILFFSPANSGFTQAQGFDPGKLSFNISAGYIKSGGDLNKYWGNAFSPGIGTDYLLNEVFNLSASLSVAHFSPRVQYPQEIYPKIYIVNLTGELVYNFIHLKHLTLGGTGGIISATFLFGGEAEDKVSTNDSESEFGLSAGFISGVSIFSLPEIRLFVKLNSIFSSPGNINLLIFGISVVLI